MELTSKDITPIVKNNKVKISYVTKDIAVYSFEYIRGELCGLYYFNVPLNDVGDGRLLSEDKAIIYMRWIRKAIENKEIKLVRCYPIENIEANLDKVIDNRLKIIKENHS